MKEDVDFLTFSTKFTEFLTEKKKAKSANIVGTMTKSRNDGKTLRKLSPNVGLLFMSAKP